MRIIKTAFSDYNAIKLEINNKNIRWNIARHLNTLLFMGQRKKSYKF